MSKDKQKVFTFDLAVKYNVNYDGKVENVDEEYAKLTKSYIEYAVTSAHKEGLSSQFRRIYAGIEQKIDLAISTKTFVVSFSPAEFTFIKDAFASEKTKFVPTLAKYVIALEDALLECK